MNRLPQNMNEMFAAADGRLPWLTHRTVTAFVFRCRNLQTVYAATSPSGIPNVKGFYTA